MVDFTKPVQVNLSNGWVNAKVVHVFDDRDEAVIVYRDGNNKEHASFASSDDSFVRNIPEPPKVWLVEVDRNPQDRDSMFCVYKAFDNEQSAMKMAELLRANNPKWEVELSSYNLESKASE